MSWRREFLRGDDKLVVRLEHIEDDHYRVRVGERSYRVRARALSAGGVRFSLLDAEGRAGAAHSAASAGVAGAMQVRVAGTTWRLGLPGARRGAGGPGGDGNVLAPMTGRVLSVLVAPGDEVTADQPLVVLTAMKMEHKLSAGIAGVVETVRATPGATVEQGAVMVEVCPGSAED